MESKVIFTHKATNNIHYIYTRDTRDSIGHSCPFNENIFLCESVNNMSILVSISIITSCHKL